MTELYSRPAGDSVPGPCAAVLAVSLTAGAVVNDAVVNDAVGVG
ncbi:hypothetical protein [Streptomyces sp. WMMB 322]|nr:hypothetical protein [Streptomyces sp. WMMB 322]SCK18508.1 hypothetical protein H180DRAFT_01290 [Streptomyces sp. WMMB 322]